MRADATCRTACFKAVTRTTESDHESSGIVPKRQNRVLSILHRIDWRHNDVKMLERRKQEKITTQDNSTEGRQRTGEVYFYLKLLNLLLLPVSDSENKLKENRTYMFSIQP